MSIKKIEQLTEQLSDQTDALYGIAEFSNDGFWDWKINEDWEYMSPQFWEILGYDPERKRHHPSEWQAIIHPDDLPKVFDSFNEHVASRGVKPFKSTVRYKHCNTGEWITLICRGKVIKWNADGSPARAVGTHTII
jgi:PAS domain-containing protein